MFCFRNVYKMARGALSAEQSLFYGKLKNSKKRLAVMRNGKDMDTQLLIYITSAQLDVLMASTLYNKSRAQKTPTDGKVLALLQEIHGLVKK